MRYFLSSLSLSLALLCMLGTIPLACAQEQAIMPHRAIYDMSMASAKSGSNITDISGRLQFEWRDMCDGWAIQQHMKLHLAAEEDSDQDLISNELTWEAKNGKQYTFNIHHETNGKETESYRGKAVQNTDGSVSVSYTLPKGKTLHFPTGTLFPTAHTELVLRNATEGTNFFTRRVFDGSDADGANDISAFILPPRAVALETGLSSELMKNPLVSMDAHPVHFAFFKINDTRERPDYEMDLSLLPNSIARHIKIDYGDFSVIGTLINIESLPQQHCP